MTKDMGLFLFNISSCDDADETELDFSFLTWPSELVRNQRIKNRAIIEDALGAIP